MSLTLNYAQLTTNLQAWVEDASPDFIANIDAIIGEAELLVIRELNLSIFDVEADVVLAANTNKVTKPANYVQSAGTITYIDGNGKLAFLAPRSRDWIVDYASSAPTGDPLYIADFSQTQWEVAPVQTVLRTATVRYISRPAQLSATPPNNTTWLSTYCADLLFYACLISGEKFLKADDRLELWKTEYAVRLADAKVELRKYVRAEYP